MGVTREADIIKGMRAAILLAVFLVACAVDTASAQIGGLLTPYVGLVSGDDAEDVSSAFGVSMAALEIKGVGVEVDFAHSENFDSARFDDSGVTSFMINFLTGVTVGRWRPFGVVGAGLLRARACVGDPCARVFSRTDAGFTLGGGLSVPISEMFAVRGDLRYFRYFDEHPDVSRTGSGPFGYWRTTVGVTYMWPIAER